MLEPTGGDAEARVELRVLYRVAAALLDLAVNIRRVEKVLHLLARLRRGLECVGGHRQLFWLSRGGRPEERKPKQLDREEVCGHPNFQDALEKSRLPQYTPEAPGFQIVVLNRVAIAMITAVGATATPPPSSRGGRLN